MTKTNTLNENEVISVRFSSRIMRRLRRITDGDGQHTSEFIRLAVLQLIERRERAGTKAA